MQYQGNSKDADSAPGGESHTSIWVKQVLPLPTKHSRNYSVRGRLCEMAGKELNWGVSVSPQPEHDLYARKEQTKIVSGHLTATCHRSPLQGGYTSPSPSSCDGCSFCSSFSCSDSEIKLSTKGERLVSKNKAHELGVRRHSMTALQKPAWGERCCLQTELGWGSTASFAGYRYLRVSLCCSHDKFRNFFLTNI